jgi:hypothetical protein
MASQEALLARRSRLGEVDWAITTARGLPPLHQPRSEGSWIVHFPTNYWQSLAAACTLAETTSPAAFAMSPTARRTPMSIRFACPDCPAVTTVPDYKGGTLTRCPNCNARCLIPQAESSPPSAPHFPADWHPFDFKVPPVASSSAPTVDDHSTNSVDFEEQRENKRRKDEG